MFFEIYILFFKIYFGNCRIAFVNHLFLVEKESELGDELYVWFEIQSNLFAMGE